MYEISCLGKLHSAGLIYPSPITLTHSSFYHHPGSCWHPGSEHIISYFCVATDKKWRQLPKEQRRLRPAGLYAVTCFSGDYMNTAAAYERLRDYMQAHHLKPAGPSYEESLQEDMSTANPEEFITRLSIPICIP